MRKEQTGLWEGRAAQVKERVFVKARGGEGAGGRTDRRLISLPPTGRGDGVVCAHPAL